MKRHPHIRDLLLKSLGAASILVFILMAFVSVNSQDGAPGGLPAVFLEAGGRTIRAEIAHTDAARTMGLMFREQLGTDEGMLFVFPDDAPRAFWMKNTSIPLAIAFMNAEGGILNIEEMRAMTETPHFSAGNAKYALEMNAEWFARHGVSPGDVVQGLDAAPPAE